MALRSLLCGLKNQRCFLSLLFLVFVTGFLFIFNREPKRPLETRFPPKIKVSEENLVMTPEEFMEKRKLEKVRYRQRTVQYQQWQREQKQEVAEANWKRRQLNRKSHQLPQRPPKRPETTVPAKHRYEDKQQFLAVKEDAMSVFSAFLDGDFVRILGYKLQRYNEPPTCQFLRSPPPLGKDKEQLTPVAGIVQNIPESHRRKFTACYVFCRIPPGVKPQSILAVKLTPPKGSNPAKNSSSAILPIQQSLEREIDWTWKADFSVCVAPIQNQYNKVNDIVEMIEFNRILGAEKFIFYNHSVGDKVNKVLHYYASKNVVHLINWPIPLRVGPDRIDPDIHYYGQLLAHNDCLYRSRHHSNYTAILDLDEFIVPLGPNMTSWHHMIARRRKSNPSAVAFQFKNCFFRKEWPANKGDLKKFKFKHSITKFKSVVLGNILREEEFYGYNLRSKCIVDPLRVETLGIHNIWKTYGIVDTVPESVGYLRHYRNFSKPKEDKKLVRDDLVLEKYGRKLVRAVEEVWNELELIFGKFD